MKFLLLDFGSTFIKYSFYDNSARRNTDVASLAFPEAVIDADGRYEVDRRKIDEILRRIMNEAELNGCTAVFTCVQMHGYLVKNNGEFSNYISWKDKRGCIYLNPGENNALFNNGTLLKANLPRLSLRTYQTLVGSEFFTLGSYVAYLLTGKNVTHITDACASGFYTVDGKTDSKTIPGIILP